MRAVDPYKRIARFYDRVIGPMDAGLREVALDLLPPQAGWRVLDVGCGTGTGLVGYIDAGCAATGVDMSPAMLEQATARLGDRAELLLVGGDRLPFDDGRFDLVTTTMVLHEVPVDERVEFLTEIARVTRPGGRIVITDFRFGSFLGWKGPLLRGMNWLIERFAGHYEGYRTFKDHGGLPAIVESAMLSIDGEKIVAGGNVAVYVLSSDDPDLDPGARPTEFNTEAMS